MAPIFELSSSLRRHLQEPLPFERLLDMPGKVHRAFRNRRTVEFEAGGKRYFIKAHRGCGWGEVIKEWLQGRHPINSARNEWEAIERLHQLGIPTMTLAGKGLRGRSPAGLESFVITEALEGMVSLEDLVRDWGGLKGPARQRLQDALVDRLAVLARRFHDGGLNHRDFYLCHFLVRDREWTAWRPGDVLDLHVIDLHRVQCRDKVPERWVIKDLGALLCSSFDWGVRRRDLARFVRGYAGKPWRGMNASEKTFWRSVWRRAYSLFTGFYKRRPPGH